MISLRGAVARAVHFCDDRSAKAGGQPVAASRGVIIQRLRVTGAAIVCGLSFAFLHNALPRAGTTSGPASHKPRPSIGSPKVAKFADHERLAYFKDIAAASGIRYRWKMPVERALNDVDAVVNGCAVLDFNNDGNQDILLIGQTLALYVGDGRGHFKDVTVKAGLSGFRGHFMGCAVGDYDNDGYDDIYISGYREGLLLHNEQGQFVSDVTNRMGLSKQPWGSSCGFADLDGDGYLDLYVANYLDYTPSRPHRKQSEAERKRTQLDLYGPLYLPGVKGVLYHNIGGSAFENVTRAWGAESHQGKGLGVAFADFDGSGRAGMVVANDKIASNLWTNSGKGLLRDQSATSGMNVDTSGGAYAGMGVDWGDYNNDGKLDLFITTFSNEPKYLFHNDGDSMFTSASLLTGFTTSSLPYVSFGCKFFDANNDGWLDLMIASGGVTDTASRKPGANIDFLKQPTQFFLNRAATSKVAVGARENREFANASEAAGLDKLRKIIGRGLATGDFDNDGRVDVLVVDSDGAPQLLHNESDSVGNWAGFRLSGMGAGNRDGYGAVTTIYAGGQKLVRQCQPCGSYLASSDKRVHFGLGGAARIDRMTVRWPNGVQDIWTDVPVGRYFDLTPGKHP